MTTVQGRTPLPGEGVDMAAVKRVSSIFEKYKDVAFNEPQSAAILTLAHIIQENFKSMQSGITSFEKHNPAVRTSGGKPPE